MIRIIFNFIDNIQSIIWNRYTLYQKGNHMYQSLEVRRMNDILLIPFLLFFAVFFAYVLVYIWNDMKK
jgi:hypothetical protein